MNRARVLPSAVLFIAALIFGLAGPSKLAARDEFRAALLSHEVVPYRLISMTVLAVPAAETVVGFALGAALVTGRWRPWALLAAGAMVSTFVCYLIAVMAFQGHKVECGCNPMQPASVGATLVMDMVLWVFIFLAFRVEVASGPAPASAPLSGGIPE